VGIGLALPLLICSALIVHAEVDLGIPARAPWLRTNSRIKGTPPTTQGGSSPVEKKEVVDLFWPTLKRDLISVERWRFGLIESTRYIRARPEVFLRAPENEAEYFEEYRDEAVGTWVRALDYFRALDSVIDRYAGYSALDKRKKRRAAFMVAYAAYAAQTRFAAELRASVAGGALTSTKVDREGVIAGILNRPVPALGLGVRSYFDLGLRLEGETAVNVAGALESLYRRFGGVKALSGVLRRGGRAWSRQRRKDAGFFPEAKRARLSESRATALLKKYPLSSIFPTSSSTIPDREEIEAVSLVRKPLLLAIPDFQGVAAPQRLLYAFHTLRYWFNPPPPVGRPEVLVRKDQASVFLEKLLPGDLLISRREFSMAAVGESGYWTRLGIFLGTKQNRVALSSDFDFEKRFRRSAREKYVLAASTRPLVVAPLEEEGVRIVSFDRFAATDALAALRPTLPHEKIADALGRCLLEVGKPFDHSYDLSSREAISGTELVRRAFTPGPAGPGLRFPFSYKVCLHQRLTSSPRHSPARVSLAQVKDGVH